MKTVQESRPQYPTYRSVHHMTARRPVLELILGGVLVAFLAAAGLSLINIIVGVTA